MAQRRVSLSSACNLSRTRRTAVCDQAQRMLMPLRVSQRQASPPSTAMTAYEHFAIDTLIYRWLMFWDSNCRSIKLQHFYCPSDSPSEYFGIFSGSGQMLFMSLAPASSYLRLSCTPSFYLFH